MDSVPKDIVGGTINERVITLAWVTRRGAHSIETIASIDLEGRIMSLFDRRIEAVAWYKDDREDVVGSVVPPDGGELTGANPHGRWTWWIEKGPHTDPR